jgi:hypothetical protein
MSDDLNEYKGKVQTKSAFDEVNNGKTPLKEKTDYVFSLQKTFIKKQVKNPEFDKVTDKLYCVWEEETTKNIVLQDFRIDVLNWSEEPKYRSKLIVFLEKLGRNVPENQYPDLGNYFIDTMKMKAQVAVRSVTSENKVKLNYNIDLNTVKKFNA